MAQSKFKIKKLVEAIDEDMGHSYLEHVSLSGLSGNKTYSYVKYDATTKNTTTIEFTANSQGEAVVDIPMKHGDTADFTVDAGVEYQITEDGGNFVSSYTINSLNNKGNIVKNSSDQLTKTKGLSTEVETADENESVEVVFKSVYEYTQSLTIAKKTGRQRVLGMADYDSDDEFEFTIEFFEMTPNTFFESDVGVVRADEDGEAIKTFNLKNGQSVTFKDMPEGVKYRIAEAKTDTWMPTYEFRDTKKVVRDADKSVKNKIGVSIPDTNDDLWDSETTCNILQPDFKISKEADKDMYKAGEYIFYEVDFKQIVENGVASNVILKDELPEGVELDADSVSLTGISDDVQNAVEVSKNKINCVIASVKDTDNPKLVYKTKVLDSVKGKSIRNVVQLTSDSTFEKVYKSDAKVKIEKDVHTGAGSSILLFAALVIIVISLFGMIIAKKGKH